MLDRGYPTLGNGDTGNLSALDRVGDADAFYEIQFDSDGRRLKGVTGRSALYCAHRIFTETGRSRTSSSTFSPSPACTGSPPFTRASVPGAQVRHGGHGGAGGQGEQGARFGRRRRKRANEGERRQGRYEPVYENTVDPAA